MNVVRSGAAAPGLQLFARLLDVLADDWYLSDAGLGTQRLVYQMPDPDQLPSVVTAVTIPSIDAHFPYGFNVEPD